MMQQQPASMGDSDLRAAYAEWQKTKSVCMEWTKVAQYDDVTCEAVAKEADWAHDWWGGSLIASLVLFFAGALGVYFGAWSNTTPDEPVPTWAKITAGARLVCWHSLFSSSDLPDWRSATPGEWKSAINA